MPVAFVKVPKTYRGDTATCPGWFGNPDDVWFRCSNGHLGRLVDHDVDANGEVSPSVQCPTDGCTFHDHVVLEDWNG